MSNTPARSAGPSRSLPSHPNLEHLKNEAKQRLKAMRLDNANVRLADAQLVVARTYGFTSWRRLKSFTDALRTHGKEIVEAVRNGRIEKIGKVLDVHDELVNATTDPDQPLHPSDTPAMRLIHLAVAENQGEVLRLLVERGANLNVRNAGGRLALHDCFELDHDDFAKMLIDAGAVPDVCAAAAYGMHERLEEILRLDPKLANDLTTGESPLGWSAYGAQPESARILFRHGAIADRPPYDTGAWGPAAMVASVQMARVLIEHGANPNWHDENGDTALHRVIRSRIVLDPAPFVEVMINAGVDATVRNAKGATALDEALTQSNRIAETYYPVRPIGPKKLDRTIELLRSATGR
jgi:hypothetical protein